MKSFTHNNQKVFFNSIQKINESSGDSSSKYLFLNGLTDSQSLWFEIIESMPLNGNYVTIDLFGQGETLKNQLEEKNQKNFRIPVDEQCELVSQLLKQLEINEKINLVGYSYGGGIAIKWASMYPEKVDKLVLLLPYIMRLDHASPFVRTWWGQLEQFKKIPGIFGRQVHMLERVYQHFIENYMHQRYSGKLPQEELRTAAIELSSEIMKLNVLEHLESLPRHSTYLITAENDSLIPQDLYKELWSKLSPEVRQAWIKIVNGEHLLLEQAPLLVARWLTHIMETPLSQEVFIDAV